MARKPDPERIYLARRDARFQRLARHYHLGELEAGHRLAAWEREAERQGLDRHAADFWDEGERWMTEDLPHGV